MVSKRQKRAAKRARAQHDAAASAGAPVEQYKPKAGPGQTFTRELIDVESGYAKRFRNIGTTPLSLAYYRGQLCSPADSKIPKQTRVGAEDRFAAGERFEKLWYVLHRSGARDSTDQGIGGSDGLFFTEARELASDQLAKIRARMSAANYSIVAQFCGVGAAMAEALRMSGVEAHRDGTAFRIREALDDLVYATTGQSVHGESATNAMTIALYAPSQKKIPAGA